MDHFPPPRLALYLCDYCGADVLLPEYGGVRTCDRCFSPRLEFVSYVESDEAADFR